MNVNEDLLPISDQNLAVAETMGVRPEIHREDFIFHFVDRKWKGDRERSIRNYYDLGKYSADRARDVMDDILRVKSRVGSEWQPDRILDFASGFGNATRHFKHAFPQSNVSSCDIHDQAVQFNTHVLKIESYLSSFTPEDINLPKQDVIYVMSLFSHLPATVFGRWISALGKSLRPGGALVFTANGYVTDKTGKTAIIVDGSGYGFRPQSEQNDLPGEQYGLTISYPKFVTKAISEAGGLRLASLREGYWWTTQDTYVCIRDD
jgi:SAM-dependent methyltransferase